MLKLRPLAYEFMRVDVHDGCSTYFWFDNLMGSGKLSDQTIELGIRYLGIDRRATVAVAATDTSWKIRSRGQRRFPETYAKITEVQISDCTSGKDRVLWRQDNFDISLFSLHLKLGIRFVSRRTRLLGRNIWFSQAVLRHSFIVWLAFNNRLSTGYRGLGE